MADKKRNDKNKKTVRDNLKKVQTFDDTLNMIMAQTIACNLEGDGLFGENVNAEDGTKVYRKDKKNKRVQQDAYTVAQNMVDRTQFRY